MEDPATTTTAPGNPPQSWGEAPNFRGKSGIILLCFSTLIICTWSTVHFNIPTKRYSGTRRFFLQVCWMVIALYAPEFLLFLAINEIINADTLVERVLAVHKGLTGPRLLDSMGEYIGGRVKWLYVSNQCPYVIYYSL